MNNEARTPRKSLNLLVFWLYKKIHVIT